MRIPNRFWPVLFLFMSLGVNSAFSAYKVGEKVKNFTLTDLNGNQIQLYDIKNKVIMLNFFATW